MITTRWDVCNDAIQQKAIETRVEIEEQAYV